VKSSSEQQFLNGYLTFNGWNAGLIGWTIGTNWYGAGRNSWLVESGEDARWEGADACDVICIRCSEGCAEDWDSGENTEE
jgi:hypothetical protein